MGALSIRHVAGGSRRERGFACLEAQEPRHLRYLLCQWEARGPLGKAGREGVEELRGGVGNWKGDTERPGSSRTVSSESGP